MKKASELWNKEEWHLLCWHLHNSNAENDFVMGFVQNEKKIYVRSKKKKAKNVMGWAYDTILGKTKSPIAFVPYASNSKSESCWCAFDFDAHDGNSERARGYAHKVFEKLQHCGYYLILEESGSGGWHIWVISRTMRSVKDWRQFSLSIINSARIQEQKGCCELFPSDVLPGRFAIGMRAPGSWNPGTDKFSTIYFQDCEELLKSLINVSASKLSFPLPEIERNSSFSKASASSPILAPVSSPRPYSMWKGRWSDTFRINLPSTRNEQLCQLVGHIFYQVGYEMAQLLVTAQFEEKTVETNANLKEHLLSFDALWKPLYEKWQKDLTDQEYAFLHQLDSENEREIFRIIRSFFKLSHQSLDKDFPIAQNDLAGRLGITRQGVAWIIDKFIKLRLIERTARHIPNKQAARYQWMIQ